jgi:hypothetical protein
MKARKSLDAARILRQRDQGGEHGQYRPRHRHGGAHASIRDFLQALVYHGTMTPAEALEVVDKAVHAAARGAKDKSQMEAFSRVKIDQFLKDTEWRLTNEISVRYEYSLDHGGRADYVLFDRQGRALAVLEAKSTSINLSAGSGHTSAGTTGGQSGRNWRMLGRTRWPTGSRKL